MPPTATKFGCCPCMRTGTAASNEESVSVEASCGGTERVGRPEAGDNPVALRSVGNHVLLHRSSPRKGLYAGSIPATGTKLGRSSR